MLKNLREKKRNERKIQKMKNSKHPSAIKWLLKKTIRNEKK